MRSFRDIRFVFFSSRRRHTRLDCDWSSDVCSSDLPFQVGRRIGIGARSRAAVHGDGGTASPVEERVELRLRQIPYVRHGGADIAQAPLLRSEEHTSELQSQSNLVCRLLLEKKK